MMHFLGHVALVAWGVDGRDLEVSDTENTLVKNKQASRLEGIVDISEDSDAIFDVLDHVNHHERVEGLIEHVQPLRAGVYDQRPAFESSHFAVPTAATGNCREAPRPI